jgi:hypothetical protein
VIIGCRSRSTPRYQACGPQTRARRLCGNRSIDGASNSVSRPGPPPPRRCGGSRRPFELSGSSIGICSRCCRGPGHERSGLSLILLRGHPQSRHLVSAAMFWSNLCWRMRRSPLITWRPASAYLHLVGKLAVHLSSIFPGNPQVLCRPRAPMMFHLVRLIAT